MTHPRPVHPPTPAPPLRHGQAMLVTLTVVTFMSAMVAASLLYAGQDRKYASMEVHNTTVDRAVDATLQFGRSFFTANYFPTPTSWNTYLAYFAVPHSIADVQAAHPELMPAFVADAGYVCFTYLHDNIDEIPLGGDGGWINNIATQDNDGTVYVGAYCDKYNAAPPPDGGVSPTAAEAQGTLEYDVPQSQNQLQYGGSTNNINNASMQINYR